MASRTFFEFIFVVLILIQTAHMWYERKKKPTSKIDSEYQIEAGWIVPTRFCFTLFLEDLVMEVSVITNRGVGIVRSAANRHEKCEIVDCVSSTRFENTASELATKSGEWWDGATGTITMLQGTIHSLSNFHCPRAPSWSERLRWYARAMEV